MSTYTKHKNIIQLVPLSEGDMTICSPEAGNIARGQYILSRVNKLSCHPHSRATIVLLYRTIFETNKRHTIGQTHVTPSATAHLGEYDVRG